MTITETGTIIPGTPDEIIACGRELYRRAQQINWPEDSAITLVKAASRLWTETEVMARVRADGYSITAERLAAHAEAAGLLLAAIREHCGPAAAAFASGQDGSVAA